MTHALNLIRASLLLVAVSFLLACETEKVQETRLAFQQNMFLQSLELIESGGSLLQSHGVAKEVIDDALARMDQGLAKAFEVEQDFLRRLDPRLPRMYQEHLIAGVEQYRLGVEGADRNQQLNGLRSISQWARFWSENKSAVLLKMAEITGLPTTDNS